MRFTLLMALVSLALPMTSLLPAQEAISRTQLLTIHHARQKALSEDDVDGRARLAAWCQRKGLNHLARKHARVVIRSLPDHAEAREILGQMKHEGRWQSRHRVLPQLGYRKYRGQWLAPEAYARVKTLEAEQRRWRGVVATIRRHHRALLSSAEKRRIRARDALVAIADKEKIVGLADDARRIFDSVDQLQRSGVAWIELRAQLQGPTSFRQFTTSLGSGNPVTIELPSSRRVSIGTTVGVPVGR